MPFIEQRGTQMTSQTIKVTALRFNHLTGNVDLPVEYIAQSQLEAVRWANCNQDYIRNVRYIRQEV